MTTHPDPHPPPAQPHDESADSLLLLDVARAVLSRSGGQRWTLQPTESWCFARPPDLAVRRAHGWKLHVSATPLSAALVLARSAEVLIRRTASFKFAVDLERVTRLGDVWHDRGTGGKFITVYPEDDDQFRILARELDVATAGLSGPRILSDRPVRPCSLVSFRYGQFSGGMILTDDGVLEPWMTGPDGSRVKDERTAGFVFPPWAAYPFPDESVAPTSAAPVLLGGRFKVVRAIRHANKGGVYRALDERTGLEVIVKHARAHVGARLDGTDVRDRLRDEARMLEQLAPLGVTPGKVHLFDEQGDLFLAEELVPGQPLNQWQSARARDGGPGADEAAATVTRLVTLLRTVHEAGFVIRDFKPHNVMVTPAGDLRLIDTEYVVEAGQERAPAYTRGFAAPEVRALGLHASPAEAGKVAGPEADRFSLGVVLFSVLTDLDPRWAAGWTDEAGLPPDAQPALPLIALAHPPLAPFCELIDGLTRADPGARWTLPHALAWLAGPSGATGPSTGTSETTATAATTVATTRPVLPPYRPRAIDRLLDDGLAHLQRTMTPWRASLWPAPEWNVPRSDPCNTWNGAAGVLATLTHAARARESTSLLATVAEAARWLDERLFSVDRLLPGLCFGRSGTAWALYDAARLLGDTAMAERAITLAERLPTRWPSPDFTHGLSGAGTAHLHLGQATADGSLLDTALACADAVLDAADRADGDWTWPTSRDTDSVLAGAHTYGFAHGTAGVGTFLLAAAAAAGARGRTGDAGRFAAAALGAGDTLVRAARVEDGRAAWPAEVGGKPQLRPATQWCNGPAGIGTFLVRLGSATGLRRFADLAEQAAAAAVSDPWRAIAGACCGNAGTGHFLLDMAEITGEARYRTHAEGIAAVIDAQHCTSDGLRLVADATSGSEYGNGAAGILDFLLRLRHGGPRPWSVSWTASTPPPEGPNP
ncbi:class IV lanthionine synthetase LanL [Streptomyces sp. DSM 40907]|uniref:class IV lanthionine synthetase LanL n=1 Tax=Streptomyces kutzneri TaxID=3051179 RepID=UPI0028D2F342|nr:class IV lanthionine synthetase LanL [Streptomyces sp. DSM 40907]